jgi:hypothetical protein
MLFLGQFLSTMLSRDLFKCLHCFFIVVVHSPLSLIVSGNFLRGSDWEKGSEDSLLRHVAERNYLCYFEGILPALYCE